MIITDPKAIFVPIKHTFVATAGGSSRVNMVADAHADKCREKEEAGWSVYGEMKLVATQDNWVWMVTEFVKPIPQLFEPIQREGA